MAMFTPSFSGLKGRALFSLLFAAPMIHATDSVTTKDGETITVTADANTATEATDGYQPLSTSTATLTDMPMLDIPQVVNTVSDQVLENQNATTLDEALYNVSNVVQTNTLGGTQDAFVRRGFGANRDGSIMTNGLRTVLPRSFNAATERVEVLKGPASTLYGILDHGGLINVVTKRPEKHSMVRFQPPPPVLVAALGNLISQVPLKALSWRIALPGKCRMKITGETSVKSAVHLLPRHSPFGDNATVTMLYSHRDYKTPFDRGTIFDLTTKQPVNVDRKIRFDEPFNITDGQSDLAQLNAEYHLNSQWTARFDYSYSGINTAIIRRVLPRMMQRQEH